MGNTPTKNGIQKQFTEDQREVIYSQDHWKLFHLMRSRASDIVHGLKSQGYHSLVYGSLARGDITVQSDLDVLILNPTASYRLELAIESLSYPIERKYIVQSTPNDNIKLVYELPDKLHIIMFLSSLSSLGFDFYHFAGVLDEKELENGIRKPGVNKKLYLIEPTENGHRQTPISDRKDEVAKILGISDLMVKQRMRVLTRRKKKGRTGVFLKQELSVNDNVEAVLRDIARTNRLVRRRLERR